MKIITGSALLSRWHRDNYEQWSEMLRYVAKAEAQPQHTGRPLRFALSGTRDCLDWELVFFLLARIPATWTMLEGEAKGVDFLGKAFWMCRGGAVEPYPANWAVLKGRAGHVRNETMLGTMPDMLVAIHQDGSPGTADAVRIARGMGIPTFRFLARQVPPGGWGSGAVTVDPSVTA